MVGNHAFTEETRAMDAAVVQNLPDHRCLWYLVSSKSTREILIRKIPAPFPWILSISTFGGGRWRFERQLSAVVWSLPHPKQWHRNQPGFLPRSHRERRVSVGVYRADGG